LTDFAWKIWESSARLSIHEALLEIEIDKSGLIQERFIKRGVRLVRFGGAEELLRNRAVGGTRPEELPAKCIAERLTVSQLGRKIASHRPLPLSRGPAVLRKFMLQVSTSQTSSSRIDLEISTFNSFLSSSPGFFSFSSSVPLT
jgi:hypothetical protein